MATMAAGPTARTGGMTQRTENSSSSLPSLGTVFEWYDFYIYGSAGTFLGGDCSFPRVNRHCGICLSASPLMPPVSSVRPFGAVFFGRRRRSHWPQIYLPRHHHGDGHRHLPGRRAADLRQLPAGSRRSYLVWPRLLQGLALGGEYGGAATYVAEHARKHKRGYATSYIQTTATLGLFWRRHPARACRGNMVRRTSPSGAGAFRSCSRSSSCGFGLHPAQAE